MKYQFLSYLVLSTTLLFLGCKKEKISPVNTAFFNITEKEHASIDGIPLPDVYTTSTVVKAKMTKKLSRWVKYDEGPLWLKRLIGFDLTLANGEVLNVEFTLTNSETNEDLLLLDENNTLSETSHRSKHWQYKDKRDELNNFYNEELGLRIVINNSPIPYHAENTGDSFSFEAMLHDLNGEAKIYAEIKFEGFALIYDWKYHVQNGIFKGIMD